MTALAYLATIAALYLTMAHGHAAGRSHGEG